MQKKPTSYWTLLQKKRNNTWVYAVVLAAFFCVCLGMLFGWWPSRGFEWGGRPTNAMDAARNADTSNFDNVLKF